MNGGMGLVTVCRYMVRAPSALFRGYHPDPVNKVRVVAQMDISVNGVHGRDVKVLLGTGQHDSVHGPAFAPYLDNGVSAVPYHAVDGSGGRIIGQVHINPWQGFLKGCPQDGAVFIVNPVIIEYPVQFPRRMIIYPLGL